MYKRLKKQVIKKNEESIRETFYKKTKDVMEKVFKNLLQDNTV